MPVPRFIASGGIFHRYSVPFHELASPLIRVRIQDDGAVEVLQRWTTWPLASEIPSYSIEQAI